MIGKADMLPHTLVSKAGPRLTSLSRLETIVLKVAGLANPLCLIEIDVITVVEETEDCMG